MGIFTAAFYVGSLVTIPKEMASEMTSGLKDEAKNIDAIHIFAHNFEIALIMFVPGAGIAYAAGVGVATGFGYSALASITPGLTEKIPALALLFIMPFGVMELVAYSIGMQRSIILIQAIRKKTWKKEIKPTLIYIGIVCGILLAAAFIEFGMITMVKT